MYYVCGGRAMFLIATLCFPHIAIAKKPPGLWRLFSHNGTRNVAGSANDLIGLEEERREDGEPERLGSLEIDDQLKPGGAFDRQVGRFRAPQEAVDVGGHAPRQVVAVRPIGQQAPSLGKGCEI